MPAHSKHECRCNNVGCMFCDGGLYACDVCMGIEGSVPTDCPGERMTSFQEDQVYAGELDYREGRGWVKPDGTGGSMGDHEIRRQKRYVN